MGASARGMAVPAIAVPCAGCRYKESEMVNPGVAEGRAVGGGTSVLVGAFVYVGTGVDEGRLVCVAEGERVEVMPGDAVTGCTDGSTTWVTMEQPIRTSKAKTSKIYLIIKWDQDILITPLENRDISIIAMSQD